MIGITITGVDKCTSFEDISLLLDAGAEVAVLWTETPEGRNRYPSVSWMVNMRSRCRQYGSIAVHVCGSGARKRLLKSGGALFIHGFNRIQINGRVSVDDLCRVCDRYEVEVITQNHATNAELLNYPMASHAILVDGSGGRGIAPAEWIRPITRKRVGFAGGLGPDNLAAELPKIAAVATGDWWVDMESSVRTDDWFDVEKALEAVRIWKGAVRP